MTLKERREALGLTQRRIAKLLKIHINTWHAYENLRKRKHRSLMYEPECPAWLERELRKLELDPMRR